MLDILSIIIICPSGGGFPEVGGYVVDVLIILTGGAQIVIIKSERLVGC